MTMQSTTSTVRYRAIGMPEKKNTIASVGLQKEHTYAYENTPLVYIEPNSLASIQLKQFETLQGFSENLLKNMKSIDPEITAIVDEFFWELI